jgi:hypothetical protein
MVKGEGEKAKLAYKKILIKGVSFFCDWHDVDLIKNGFIDIKKL